MGADREPPRVERSGERGAEAAEVGGRGAPAVARPAVVALSATVVRLGQDRRAPDGHAAIREGTLHSAP